MSKIYGHRAPRQNKRVFWITALILSVPLAHLIAMNIRIQLVGPPLSVRPWVEPQGLLMYGSGIAVLGGAVMLRASSQLTGAMLLALGLFVMFTPVYSPVLLWRALASQSSPFDLPIAIGSGLLSLTYGFFLVFSIRYRKSGVKGSADWGKAKALRTSRSGFVLGRDQKGNLLRYNRDGHLMTVAATRGGKGVGTIIPNLLFHPGSIICTDPKAENWYVTHAHRERMGQKTIALDPFDLTDGKGSGYNPMDLINLDSPDHVEIARSMAHNMIPDAKSGDPHWVNEARSALESLILFAKSVPDPAKHNLATVRRMVSGDAGEIKKLLHSMQNCRDCPAVQLGANRLLQKDIKELSGVLSTLQSNTHIFSSPRLTGTLSKTSFTKEDLLSDSASVYLIVPAERLEAYAPWLRTTITSIYRMITTDTHKREVKPKHRILFMLDEFANLGKMPELLSAVSLGAGFGITLWLILQDLSQVKSKYGDEWNSFLANSDVLQVFSIQDPFSCEQVSKLLGEKTVWQRKLGQVGEKKLAPEKGYDEDSRPLMRVDELRRLHPDRQILLVRPNQPVAATKIRYYQDSDFKHLASPNPYVA